ncbi:MAG: TIGR00282 family metallophosphoesterase [Candidatus Firestonebacteria bacterium]|nr:TIGR00282 family metallophosphoesterase [Candidatus Firestonebacteria bacterium]
MNILFLGDVIGNPGRKALSQILPALKIKYNADVVIINGENAAGGFGLTPDVANSLFMMGVDIITSGNHIWDKKEVCGIFTKNENLIRPANYPPNSPGKGSVIYNVNNKKIGVINLSGRAFMSPIMDCPFRTSDIEIENIKKTTQFIIIDIHAEATSEKMALGWYLDGKVSAIIGTHTHVQTADERILPNGTAYITDIGMTGALDSVIGMDKEQAINKFISSLPCKFETATKNVWVCGVYISINDMTGKSRLIERIQVKANN